MKGRMAYRITAVAAMGVVVWFSARGTGFGEKTIRSIMGVIEPSARAQSSLTAGDSPYEGRRDAPVTIIECSDFQCPYCAAFAHDALVKLRKHEIKDGKVRLVFKYFPLPFHQYAEKAAEAAECAKNQGEFWRMHDLLFDADGNLDVDSLKAYAKRLGLEQKEFDRCLESGETAETVRADKSACESAGVSGTPTFFINGKMLVGAQPYEQFETVIEQAEKSPEASKHPF